MLHLTLVTIDARTFNEVLVGFTIFPLFIDSNTRMPVVNPRDISPQNLLKLPCTLHNGAYQLGIYSEFPHEDRSGKITYEHYTSLERIPTSSVLLRVDFASIDDDGLFISTSDKDPRLAKMAYEEPPVYEE